MKPKQMVKVLYQGKMVETYSDISVMEGVEIVDSALSDITAEATEIVSSILPGESDVLVMETAAEVNSDISILGWAGGIESEWDSELIVVHPKTTTLQSIVQALRNFLTTLGGKFKWTS